MSRRVYPPELFGPPSVDDFVTLEEDMWEPAQQPGTLPVADGFITRFNMLSRLMLMEDCYGKTRGISIGVSGALRVIDAVRKLDIVYVEKPLAEVTGNDHKGKESAVGRELPVLMRKYMLERRGDSVSKGAIYSLTVSPSISKPIDTMNAEKVKFFEEARTVFEGLCGLNMPLSSGDCIFLDKDLRTLINL